MYTFKIGNMTKVQILDAMIEAYNKTKGHFAIKLPDGETVEIKAFEYMPNHEDCELFFVGGFDDPWADEKSLAKIAAYFANYEAKKAELADERDELKEFEAELAAIEDKSSDEYREKYGYYSDWYKDLYCVRPKSII